MFDMSLCGVGVLGEIDVWDFGVGVGFYVDVIEVLWLMYYWMELYVMGELYEFVVVELLIDGVWFGIFGYLMGGYGVLMFVLCYLGLYWLVLVFVLIVVLMCCLWGEKVFFGYFGVDCDVWKVYDVSELVVCVDVLKFVDGIFVD